MPIHQATLDRLRAAKISGDGLATILEQMAAGVEMLGAAASQLQLDWQQPDDELRDGDLRGMAGRLPPVVHSEGRHRLGVLQREVELRDGHDR